MATVETLAKNETFECSRELIMNTSADQVWEWLANLRNVMTANQFHSSIDCDDVVARNPKVGFEVPILHNMLEREFYRIARITRFEDYEIAWGERIPDDAGYADMFPHSEGWRVESLGPRQCRVSNRLRGRFMSPLGQLIGKQAWDAAIPVILDNDLQDVALAVGAVEKKRDIAMPIASAALLRLTNARQIDGISVSEFVSMQAHLLKHTPPESNA
ncbi:MAG TPA: SRPBCC family protein [Candidatus Binatia bacterium]|nr:SRPBCC family protein [Candidatus Binatia bacterium]